MPITMLVTLTAKIKQQLSGGLGSLLDKLHSKSTFARLGNLQQFRMKDRAGKGIDVHGVPFEPYSDAHAEKRREKGLQTGHVDLNMSGQMWASLQQEADEDSVKIFFSGESEARAMGLQFNSPQREHFGISEDDERALVKEITKALKA